MGQLLEKWGGGDKYDSVKKLLAEIFPKDGQKERIKRIMSNIPVHAKLNVKEFKNYFAESKKFEMQGVFDSQDILDIDLYYIRKEVEEEEVKAEQLKAKEKYKEVELLLNEIFKAENEAYKKQRIERMKADIEAYKKQRIERIMNNIPEPARLNVNTFKLYFKTLNDMNHHGFELLDFSNIKGYFAEKEREEKKQLNEIGKAFNSPAPI